MMNLNDREWKEFQLYKIFDHQRGRRLIAKDRNPGDLPYFSASSVNNGLTDYINNPLFTITTNAIIYSTFGDAFYVEKNFTASDEMTILTNKNMNRYSGLFITRAIYQNKSKYSFGRKAFSNKICKDRMLLPVDDSDNPDWEFMEEYIKEIEYRKIKKYKDYVCNKIKDVEYKKIDRLEYKKWQDFTIEDLFNTKIGKNIDGNKIDKDSGNTAYITRREVNNALDGFIDYDDHNYLNESFPVITIGNETATPFVQVFPFYTGTKVNILMPKETNSEYVLYFIATSLRQHKSKYNYSFTINSRRLKKQKIILPVISDGKPDYNYMEQYIKNMMLKKYNQYLEYKENNSGN